MQSFNEVTKDLLSLIVRLCGLILLFIGFWIAIQVFNEALDLYKDPTNIERIATAIEAGSNIDKSILSIRDNLSSEDEITKTSAPPEANADGIRISYFIAWIIDLLLLVLLARIAIMGIKTGGELALYDVQIKKIAQRIVKENKT